MLNNIILLILDPILNGYFFREFRVKNQLCYIIYGNIMNAWKDENNFIQIYTITLETTLISLNLEEILLNILKEFKNYLIELITDKYLKSAKLNIYNNYDKFMQFVETFYWENDICLNRNLVITNDVCIFCH